MNERIDELLWQAGGYTKIHNPNDSFLDGRYAITQEQLDKFAELIVAECVKCCEEVADINKTYLEVRLVDPEFGPKECIEVIKKHFGVEE